uniref:Purple acid phosphatase n=1 Tax=Lotharella globosa TaxID=91324 RepID=A0A7S3Z9D5_9EUKA|mmetsp:Transcript_18233/g.34803  ORF Transcript_18233/g.34803 Transcript_18233/m.34803 type:complete len:457 (+) Transcript_18233:32-1402(+)
MFLAWLVLVAVKASQFHASWSIDAPGASQTSLTVVWHTESVTEGLGVRFRPSSSEYSGYADPFRLVAGSYKNSSVEKGTMREAVLTNLRPSTEYSIQVQLSDGEWENKTYSIRTASKDNGFEFAFVADTGLEGRPDNLAIATRRVIKTIGEWNVDLVLLGGDYVYYQTDKRFGSLDNHIDKFFESIQPFASHSVIMPTYGNHEFELMENVETWKSRFSVPEGMDSGSHYAFTVGKVRFISLLAGDCHTIEPMNEAVLAWLDKELEASVNNPDYKWVIPFYHIAPFSNGHSHPSNIVLRKRLGALMEKHGIRVVLNAHDQSYERTLPLNGTSGGEWSVLSRELDCYDSETQGTIYIKTSPGGKLSNHGNSFSWFTSDDAPSYTAVRESAHHHILHVSVSDDYNEITFTVWGIPSEDYKEAHVIDEFRYTLSDNCSPARARKRTQRAGKTQQHIIEAI